MNKQPTSKIKNEPYPKKIMETTREIALRTFNKYMDIHKENPMAWHIWKMAFDVAAMELKDRNQITIDQLLEACYWAKDFGKNGSTHDIMIINKLNLAIEKATKQQH